MSCVGAAPFLQLMPLRIGIRSSTAWFGFCLAIAAPSAYSTSSKVLEIRGVAPENVSKYEPVLDKDGSQVFRCLRRHNSTTPRQRVPIEAINDGYCDCSDGSDEPGTEACAGQMETLFYCPNAQSLPMYIYTSRVNDGICDCCDGGDEWSVRASCPNTCAEEGRLLRQKQDQRVSDVHSGLQQRAVLIEKAKRNRQRERIELERLRTIVRDLEAAPKTGGTYQNLLLDITASQKKAIAFLVTLLAVFVTFLCFSLWRCFGSCRCLRRTAKLSTAEILKRVELLIQVPIARPKVENKLTLGLSLESSSLGGLTISRVEPCGLIALWNDTQDDEVCHVRAGDRIIEVAYTNDKGHEVVAETPSEMLRALKADECELTISASRGEAEVMVFSAPLMLDSLEKEDVDVREIEGGRGGLEVVDLGPKVEEWNNAAREAGACFTQLIEKGDRLIFPSGKYEKGDTVLAKLRYPCEVRTENVEVEIERLEATDKLGLHVRPSVQLRTPMDILGVNPGGLIEIHNANNATNRVVRGDHLVSVNGKREFKDMFDEFASAHIRLSIERYACTGDNVNTKAKSAMTISAPTAALGTVSEDVNSRLSKTRPAQTGTRICLGLVIACLILAGVMLVMAFILPVTFSRLTASVGAQKLAKIKTATPKAAHIATDSINAAAGDDSVVGQAPSAGPVVSEYAKWMEGANDPGGNRASDVLEDHEPSTSDNGEDDSLAPNAAERFVDVFLRYWQNTRDWVVDVWAAAKGKVKSPDERLQSTLVQSRSKADQLEQKLNGLEDSEDALVYSMLEEKCISKQIDQYKYEVCFFKSAKQGSVDIGKWRRWEAPHVALFDGGQTCHAGPSRSLRVKIHCGAAEQILEVGEPSRCSYEAIMSHPAACSEVEHQALMAWRGPRRPDAEEL